MNHPSQHEHCPNGPLRLGCNATCFSDLMINRIMTTRVASLALAATALTIAPAFADHGKRSGVSVSVSTDRGAFIYQTGHTGHVANRRYHQSNDYGRRNLNQWGQTRYEVRDLKRTAIRACRRAIVNEANYIGFRDVDFDYGRRARQIGPRGFEVTFNEVEFEGRRRDFERPVTCIVRRGTNVKELVGIPQRGHRGQYGNRGNRNYRNSQHVW